MQEKLPEFNPFSAAFQANPYPIYRQLRDRDPIHCVKGFKFNQWFLTRYQDVHFVLNDGRFRVDDLPARLTQKAAHLQQGNFKILTQTIGNWLFFLEPPNHTRLRSLVSKTFSSGRVEGLRPRIQEIVDGLIDRVQAAGRFDVMADLAAPLPALVSAEILGVPAAERDRLTQWAYDLFHVFDQPLSLKDYQHINQVAQDFQRYFQQIILHFRHSPADNLICKLLDAQQEDKLTETELLAFLSMLFSVGQETTENLIGNGMFALLCHPAELAQLRDTPDLTSSAIEELLRYDSPVQIISRTAIADVELGGKTIRSGDKVNLLLGAANRDPAKFEEPDRLDLMRRESHRLPFGSGIHYCLGAELARVQGQVAIATVLRRLQNLQVVQDRLERRKNIVLRGFKVLPVVFTSS